MIKQDNFFWGQRVCYQVIRLVFLKGSTGSESSFKRQIPKKYLFARINAWPQEQITLKGRELIYAIKSFIFKAPDFLNYHSNY